MVVHSLTKFMGGHGTTLGGAIVDSGRFPWKEHAGRFPMFSRAGYIVSRSGLHRSFRHAAYIGALPQRLPADYRRRLGALSAFLLLQGIETVALRIERHVENGKDVAEFLRSDRRVEWVNYAGFPGQPLSCAGAEISRRPGVFVDDLWGKGGFEAGKKFYDALKLFKRLVNIGDAKSLACHPASTTHRQMSPEEQRGPA